MNNSINHLHRRYQSAETSVVEVVTSHIDVTNKKNPALNVFLTTTFDQALKTAADLDRRLKNDPEIINRLPLFGVPVAHKDLFCTAGIRTTAGSHVLKDYLPPYSATVVASLENAGAVSLGKVNLDAWAHGASGENSDFGPTKNPLQPEYVPGGSSSGSAAAVAAGMVMVATGTDTGGSVRLPAAFTSTVGLKPTYGRVSRYGVIAMSSTLDSVGHITQSVADSARVLSVTSGVDPKDANTAASRPFSLSSLKNFNDLKGVTIGIPKEYVSLLTDPAVKENFSRVVKKAAALGATVTEVSLPHTKDAIAAYYILQPAEVSSNLGRFDGIRYGQSRLAFGDEAVRRIMIGTFTLSSGYYDAYYKTALKVRTLIRQEFDRVFSDVDVLLTPVSPTPPFKLGSKVNDPVAMYLSDVLTVTANIAGICGLAIPSGSTPDKLPLGVQLLGSRFAEETVYPLAAVLEEALK